MNAFNLNTAEISHLCEKQKVKNLYVFGSYLSANFSAKSDIDLIVDFNKNEIEDYFDNYYNLKFSLEKILNRSIDLLEQQAIKNPYFIESINQQKQLVYGTRN
jgi:predicted nucleotidyltransferase